MYIYLGDDLPQAIQKDLQERLREAKKNSLSINRAETLATSIEKYKTTFKIRPGSGGPARVPPMKIALDARKQPVTVKVRKYPAQQRKLFDVYFAELVSMGFLKVCTTATWRAAPLLVPKDSRSKHRTTTDLRPVNTATKPEQWPMPITETELSDFVGSKHVARPLLEFLAVPVTCKVIRCRRNYCSSRNFCLHPSSA